MRGEPTAAYVAIAAMLASTLFYLLGDTVVKIAAETLPVPQIIAIRGALAALLVAIAAFLLGVLKHWRRMLTPRVLSRGGLDAATTLLFTSALAHMRIADATAIINAVPIAATVFAIFMLHEKVSALRWSAIIAGFVGVLMILRPDPEGFNYYGLLAVAAMIVVAMRDVVTRRIAADIPSLIVTLCSTLTVSAAGFLVSLLTGEWIPLAQAEFLNLCLAAVLLFGAYHFSVVSLRFGEVSLVGPFRYAILLWALIVGYLVWGDVPDWLVISGMMLITLAGLVVFRAEIRRPSAAKLPPSSEPPPDIKSV